MAGLRTVRALLWVDDFCLNRLCPREEGGARQTSVLRQFQRANSGVNEILGGRAESEGAVGLGEGGGGKSKAGGEGGLGHPGQVRQPQPTLGERLVRQAGLERHEVG